MSEEFIPQHKIGIMSDTHGSLPAWRKALDRFGDVEAILHAGDVLYHGPRNTIPGGYTPADLADAMRAYQGTLMIARGNCDADVDQMVLNRPLSPYVTLWWQEKKILVMHGDNFALFRQLALDFKADLAISGHTHIASLIRENGTIFLNPGSTTLPKGKDPASVAVVCERGPSIFTLDGELLHRESW
ncbi:phosphodiesterase [Synergistaceae bacterium OttesenSCG-928-D05]|nr:phosphodiesterase [Synergistaceae bacterium OttesenSCG-928-D05]